METVSATEQPTLKRYDLWLLPLLSLVTILSLSLACEFLARRFFAAQPYDLCQVHDRALGFRYRPNCTASVKTAEGPWVLNSYNACGYRSRASCAVPHRGVSRIALLGSSVSQGLYVPYEQTFAVRTAEALSSRLGTPVEVQDLGRADVTLLSVYRQTDEALSLNPSVLVLAIDPYDIEHLELKQVERIDDPTPSQPATAKELRRLNGPMKRIKDSLKQSAMASVAGHYIFDNSATYINAYMRYQDHADYLRKPFSAAWTTRLEAFDLFTARMAEKAARHQVPLIYVGVPSLAQVEIMKNPNLAPGADPYQLYEKVEEIAARHGVQFVNTSDAFRSGPPADELFYVFDTHMNGSGHEVVYNVLAKDLLEKQRPALVGLRYASGEGE